MRPLFKLSTNDDHIALDRADNDTDTGTGRVDHLAVTDIDTAMRRARADIAGLRIGNAGPSHKRIGRTDSRIGARQTVAYESRAIKRRRTASTPHIRRTKL